MEGKTIKQEIKCDKCGDVALTKNLDWKRKKHVKAVVCSKCSAHKVSRG